MSIELIGERKRGDDLFFPFQFLHESVPLTPEELANIQMDAHFKVSKPNGKGKHLGVAEIVKGDFGIVVIKAGHLQTKDWPLKKIEFDLQLTSNGIVISTTTVIFPLEKDVTP
jgi:hypothetical protein